MEFRRRHRSDAFFREAGLFNAVWDINNPEPPDGFEPVKRVQFASSVWNEAAWPRAGYASSMRIRKGRIAKTFLLNDDDIIDLYFVENHIPNSHTAKEYLCVELERRAWEKYGGPPGFQAAKARKAERDALRLARRNHLAAALPPPVNQRGRGRPRGRATPGSNRQRQNVEPQVPGPPPNAPPAPPPDVRAVAGPSNPVLTPTARARMQRTTVVDVYPVLSDGENETTWSSPARQTPRRGSARKKVPVIQIDDVVDISD